MTTPTQFSQFSYSPGQPAPTPAPEPPPPAEVDLGPLSGLAGSWTGAGFNAIWRPVPGIQDRFLELNLTVDALDFSADGLGSIPNRGRRQADIFMGGLRYLQRISDANTSEGLHIEPGVWLTVPATEAPPVPASIVRMASIPHGTTITAQGVSEEIAGPPSFEAVSLNPFTIGQASSSGSAFPEQNLSTPTEFRTKPAGLVGIDQTMIDDPNRVLETAIAGQTITKTVVLDVTTESTPIIGGGTANTAFLRGEGSGDELANANAAVVRSRFWIETLAGNDQPTQLQYSQVVLLNFSGISWPHVTVATLTKQPAA